MIMLSAATAGIITGSLEPDVLFREGEQVMFICPLLWGAAEFESNVEGKEGVLDPHIPTWNPTTTD